MRKENVLIFSDVFIPYQIGGEGLCSLDVFVYHLEGDFNIHIVTSVLDNNNQCNNRILNKWVSISENVKHFIIDSLFWQFVYVFKLLVEVKPDVIYLKNSFSPVFSFLPLILSKWFKIRVVLAPSGLFQQSIFERIPLWKKLMLISVKSIGLFRNVDFLASNSLEFYDIAYRMGRKSKIWISGDIPFPSEQLIPYSKTKDVLNIVIFCNIDRAIELTTIFEVISKHTAAFNIQIVGSVEDIDHINEIYEFFSERESICIEYKGFFSDCKEKESLASSHIAIILNNVEQSDHLVLSSLLYGRPVVVSKSDCWNFLTDSYSGFNLNSHTEFDDYFSVLDFFACMEQEEYLKWSNSARTLGVLSSPHNVQLKSTYVRIFSENI